MTVIAEEYDIPDHIRGDTWEGINSISIQEGGLPVDIESAAMALKKKNTERIVMVFNSDDESENFYIDLLGSGEFRINERDMDIDAGTYEYDIQVTLTSGRIITILRGEWDIVQDVTE